MRNNSITAIEHLVYRPSIDGLRAVAVVAVLISHIFPKYLRGGFVGVDIFFVISGFLIGKIIFDKLERGNFSFFDFYSRRVRRIFPVLIIVLACTYLAGWQVLLPVEFATLGKHIAGGSLFASNVVLWTEAGYFSTASEFKPLLHLWSLGIEEQFYLVWPLLLWMFWRKKNFVLVSLLLLVTASFAYNVYLVKNNPVTAFFLPLPRFWELGLGSLIAFASSGNRFAVFSDNIGIGSVIRKHKTTILQLTAAAGLTLILCAIFLTDPGKRFPGYWALLPTAGAACIIIGGENTLINSKIFASRPFVLVGLISYPLYLWHWPIISYYNIVHPSVSPASDLMIRVGIIGASIALAWLSYSAIEKKLKGFTREVLKFWILLSAMCVLGVVGATTLYKGGFVSRFPAQVSDLLQVRNVYEHFHFAEIIRDGQCHSNPVEVSIETRIKNCGGAARPLVFIWGDSYAASLYPGLAKLAATKPFGIAQFTAGNAPPFFLSDKIAANNKSLEAANSEALEAARILQPEVIVISWMTGGMNAYDTPQKSMAGLGETVRRIRSATPKSRIVVVGPLPEWNRTLLNSMIGYSQTAPMHALAPEYMSFGLRTETPKWDEHFKTEMPKIGVSYISALDVMCNTQGCLTQVGPTTNDLTAVDSGHLTKPSSEYFVDRIGARIFSD
ncbi:acyltransferase family protein [Pseudoduganella sp. HUAS MS19]